MHRIATKINLAFTLGLLLAILGCYVETNQKRALHAKYRTEISRLLVSIETYKGINKTLPPDLSELQQKDSMIRDINVALFDYHPKGLAVADGTAWLLAVPDPLIEGDIIVGKLPGEIATKTGGISGLKRR